MKYYKQDEKNSHFMSKGKVIRNKLEMMRVTLVPTVAEKAWPLD